MKIACVSDTHTFGKQIEVPYADVLIHAGDHTFNGRRAQVESAMRWLSSLPHPHKVLVAGNHDFIFQEEKAGVIRRWIKRYHPTLHYLQDSGIEIDGVKFYGSPWQPWFHDWAFNFSADHELGTKQAHGVFSKIPEDTDVLITHGPPHGIMDAIGKKVHDWDIRVGCAALLYHVKRVKPKLHVFGHIHEGYGIQEQDGIKFVNAAICTRAYEPTNKPILVEI